LPSRSFSGRAQGTATPPASRPRPWPIRHWSGMAFLFFAYPASTGSLPRSSNSRPADPRGRRARRSHNSRLCNVFNVFAKSSRPFPAPPKSSASEYLFLEPCQAPRILGPVTQVSNTAPQDDWIAARDAIRRDVKAARAVKTVAGEHSPNSQRNLAGTPFVPPPFPRKAARSPLD
jgi:hypothetical protein